MVPLIPISRYALCESKFHSVFVSLCSRNRRYPLYFPYLKSAMSKIKCPISLPPKDLSRQTESLESLVFVGIPVSAWRGKTVLIWNFSSNTAVSTSLLNFLYCVFACFLPLDHIILTGSSIGAPLSGLSSCYAISTIWSLRWRTWMSITTS